ncbi:hypothetical protein BKA69DRAFT_1172743 [Paraphysoderma sedebokerense]|nr:hypothetical protein BKA69DRAFT_1172743 [Paraphysoderma sedebokerense]
MDKPKGHKEKLTQEHRVNDLLNKISERGSTLLDIYVDKNGARKVEIEKLSGASEFSEFYGRLKEIKDHHRRYPNEVVEPMELEFMTNHQDREDAELLERLFSGEEAYGRFLDLHTIHEEYLNLKGVKKLNYLAFLNTFTKFADIPKSAKIAEYKRYLENLRRYLERFFERTQPLFNILQIQREAIEEFDRLWKQGIYPGWERNNENENDMKNLFCVACQKQFAKQSVFDSHLSGKKHKKATENLARLGKAVNSVEEAWRQANDAKEKKEKDVAILEAVCSKYADALNQFIEATKENVERKQTLTESELKDDVEAEEVDFDDDDSDDDDKIYNPLKLPLGWDGKPIPYWLYKLHGLGIEYPCEICGNYVYMGRKAFDRHFQVSVWVFQRHRNLAKLFKIENLTISSQEFRHAHGMRCLGIPNSRHFHEITSIEDAYALWEKLKQSNKEEQFKAETEEEFEDQAGNVYDRKTYELLQRQNLI